MSTTKFWLVLAVNPLTEAVAKIGQLWSDGLKNNADKLVDRLQTVIPDETTYLSKMAEPAQQEYQRLLDASFVSRKGKNKEKIDATQGYKIKQGWQKYLRNRNHMFETVDGITAKRFKDKIAAAKDTYAERASKTTMALTGMKSHESGPARIAVFWLTGDLKARDLLRKADRPEGEPFNITTIDKRAYLRQVVNARIIQSGMDIIHASLSQPTIIAENTIINSLVQGFVDPVLGLDPFTPGGASHVDFIKENKQLYLSVKVSRV